MRGAGPSELEDFLVKKADDDPKTSTKTDETKGTVGVNNLYEGPPKETRPSGTSDAPWGEPDIKPGDHEDAHHHNNVADESSEDVRHGTLDRLFSGKATADSAHTGLLSDALRHVAAGDFETHSIHLRSKSKTKTSAAPYVVDEGTLGMRVKDLLGEF